MPGAAASFAPGSRYCSPFGPLPAVALRSTWTPFAAQAALLRDAEGIGQLEQQPNRPAGTADPMYQADGFGEAGECCSTGESTTLTRPTGKPFRGGGWLF
jgi:hypothetical protein